VLLEAPIDSNHKARVVIVDQLIDAVSGTFWLRLHLLNPNLELPLGLKCQVVFK